MKTLAIDPVLNPTVGTLNNLVDYADRRTLSRYDDGRNWFFINSTQVSLSEVAWAALHQPDYLIDLIKDGLIQIAPSLTAIPGEDFLCIYFEDAYILADYNIGKR